MPDYDDVADFYQRSAAIATPYAVLASYNVLRVLGPIRGLRVLDLATGEGRSQRAGRRCLTRDDPPRDRPEHG